MHITALSFKKRMIAATPLFSVVVFLFLGFQFDLWHPGWLVFFLVPLMPIILGVKKIKWSFSAIVFIIYLTIGLVFKAWHPGWLIFFLVPIYHILFAPIKPNEKIKTLKD